MNFLHRATMLLVLVLFPTAIGFAREEQPQDTFRQANEAYSRGDYEKAIEVYMQFSRQHGVSSSLLYNLANSFAARGRTGMAILNYERALRIDPGNEDIPTNLKQVRKDAGLYQKNKPLYERLAALLRPDQWTLIAGISFFLLSLISILTLFSAKFSTNTRRMTALCCAGVMAASIPAAVYGYYRTWNSGVVIATDARLQISPFEDAASSGIIKEGRLVRPDKTHEDYFLVTDETGRTGWLKKSAILFITNLSEKDT